MIMPKTGYGYGPNYRHEKEPSLDSVYFESIEFRQSINFWITDKGELIQCKDHETEARDYVKRNDLLLECVDWMKETPHHHRDYRSFVVFKKGWIRLVTGRSVDDGFGLSLSNKGIADKAFDAFEKCLNTSFVTNCVVDTCYEDNSPETSTTYGYLVFSKMLRELKMKVWMDA